MLTVVGLNELSQMELYSYDVIISLVDDSYTSQTVENLVCRTRAKHFISVFDDLDNPLHPEAPKLKHVAHLLDFFVRELNQDSKVLIHCHGGISRSTAVAILYLLVVHDMDIASAYNHLFNIRKMMWPNDLIIEYIDDTLQLKSELVGYNEQWKKDNLGVYWPHPPIRIKNI